MELTTNTLETSLGPKEWFTGSVYMDAVAAPAGPFRAAVTSVRFAPGARTAWHSHPNGQTIYVTDGVGVAQGRGNGVAVIRPGDRVFFAPGEDHWHGASASRFMTHLSVVEADADGNTATWGSHVTDEEYAAAPPID
ncbi:MAG: cupin domain-containing protein [Actinomycetota bacterium]